MATAAPALAAPPEAPTVTVEAVRATEATFDGVLSPGGHEPAEGTYKFIYNAGASCEGGSETAGGIALGGEPETLPPEAITGLAPATEYAVCLSVTNAASETTLSAPAPFTTPAAAAPAIEAQSASELTKNTALLSATIDPSGEASTCLLRYGRTSELKSSVACPSLPAASTGQPVSVELHGLVSGAEYHFRFFATNLKGTGEAAQPGSFSTNPFLSATTLPASVVQRATALLNGTVNPEGAAATYYFEYGVSPCDAAAGTCGTRTQTRGPVTESAAVEPFKLQALKPGVTYHYWIVAANAQGTLHGSEQSFTTDVAEPTEYRFVKDLEGGHTFGGALGIAVNQETRDVYAYDSGEHVIEQFSPAGTALSSVGVTAGGIDIQVAVDNSCFYQKLAEPACKTKDPANGDVYITNEGGVVDRFTANASGELQAAGTLGEGVAAVSEPEGVALDAEGNVYVASYGSGSVSKFSASGTVIDESFITGLSAPEAIAVDPSGNIYVDAGGGAVEYSPAGGCVDPGANPGECVPLADSESGKGIALDAAGDVFVAEYHGGSSTGNVHEYAPGTHSPIINPRIEEPGALAGVKGLAVDDTTGTLYADEGSVVKVFEQIGFAPVIVQTQPASALSSTTEALHATVNPNSLHEPAEYFFEYGTAPCDMAAETCGSQASEPSEVPLNGQEPIEVTVAVEALAPNTTYHYWVVGRNEHSGTTHGEEATFTTGPEAGAPAKDETEHKAPAGATPPEGTAFPTLTSLAPVPGPKETTPVVHPLTRAQKLQKALKACRKDKLKAKRKKCEATAHKHFGPIKKGKK
jgi:hypothetical protein